jgi:hypothetical protein
MTTSSVPDGTVPLDQFVVFVQLSLRPLVQSIEATGMPPCSAAMLRQAAALSDNAAASVSFLFIV